MPHSAPPSRSDWRRNATTTSSSSRFILKPKHSAFFATPLRLLLEQFQVRRLVLTGIAADSCILATVADAHMNEYDLTLPRDCVAAETVQRHGQAIKLMKDAMNADVRASRSVKP